MSFYKRLIVEATGCPENRAADVEELMRLEHRTLDGLSRRKFVSEARICWEAQKVIDAEEANGAAA